MSLKMPGYSRITVPQSEDSHTYQYGIQHFFYGFFLLPLLFLSIHILKVGIEQRSLFAVVFSGFMGFLTCASILSFNTKVKCDQGGLTVTYLFVFHRKVAWSNVTRLRIVQGRITSCRVYTNTSRLPVYIVIGLVHALQDDGMMLATIIEWAKLSLYPNAKKGGFEYRKLLAAE